MEKIDLGKAMHLWNCDVTGFNGDKDDNEKKKNPPGNNEKINYTVLNCVNTD